MCCCDTNGWIRVIGCAQIILHTTTLVLIFAESLNETLVETNSERTIRGSAPDESLQYMDILLQYILPVLTNVIGVAMGVFLLVHRGSIKSDRQAVYLKYCGAYTIVLLTWFMLARYNLPMTEHVLLEETYYEDAMTK